MSKATRPGPVFLGLASFQALAMFRRGIFYTFLGVYLRGYLGLSVTETTLFETIPMVLNILFQTFVWGRLADRLQLRRSLIVAGELVAAVGHPLMWLAHAACPDPRAAGWAVIWGLSLIEIFWAMSNIGWSAYLSDVYAPGERAAVQGRLASVGGAGRILGAAAGGLLYDGAGGAFAGWGYAKGGIFLVAAGAMLVSVVPLLFMPEGGVGYRPEEAAEAGAAGRLPRGAGEAPRDTAAPAGSGRAPAGTSAGGTSGRSAAGLGTGGDARRFGVFLAGMLLVNCGVNSLGAFRAQYLDLAGGFAASPREVSLAANAESAALVLVGLAMGALGRRLGAPRLLVLGTAAGIASVLGYALSPSLGLVYAAALLKGLSDGAVAAASYAYASTLIPPRKRGRYFAAYNATFQLSWGLSATLVTGPLIDALVAAGRPEPFAYRAGFLSAAGVMLLGLGVLAPLLAGQASKASDSL